MTTTLNPEVTRALAQMEVDKQAAKDAGLWDANYEQMTNELSRMFIEANDVDSVLDICFRWLIEDLAAKHELRLVRANKGADTELVGRIIVWPESGLVILPHGMTTLDALDQLRAHLAKECA